MSSRDGILLRPAWFFIQSLSQRTEAALKGALTVCPPLNETLLMPGFSFPNTALCAGLFYHHCSDEEPEAQRGEVVCLRTHSW